MLSAIIIACTVACASATTPVNVGAYSDPTDGREAIYVPIPDCATPIIEGRTVVFVFDEDCLP